MQQGYVIRARNGDMVRIREGVPKRGRKFGGQLYENCGYVFTLQQAKREVKFWTEESRTKYLARYTKHIGHCVDNPKRTVTFYRIWRRRKPKK